MTQTTPARLLPVVILALGAFAALKLASLWFGFSGAAALPTPTLGLGAPETMKEAPAPEPQAAEVERRILEQLASRRTALDARARDLDAREAVIAATEKIVNERIIEFERKRDELAAMRAEQAAKDSAEIEALVGAYERMRSKDAAAIFNALDQEILVSVASRMRTQALAGVLAEMQPERARQLTILLAQGAPDDAAGADAQTGE